MPWNKAPTVGDADPARSEGEGEMTARLQNLRILQVLAVLLSPAVAQAGSSCDFVLHWDARTLGACVDELKSEISILRLQLETEQNENRVMRGSICLLAMDLKTKSAADLAHIACEELEAARKKGKPKAKLP